MAEAEDRVETQVIPGVKKAKYRVGQRVKYYHGKGLSTGKITSIKDDTATLETKNGGSVNRAISRLKPIKET